MLITYNGVSLPYSDVSDFQEESVYDDLSKTDRACSRYTITSRFLVGAAYRQILSPGLVGVDDESGPAELMLRLDELLMQPRRALSVKFNGVELLPNPQPGNPGTVDVMNGPVPQYFRYQKLYDDLFIVEYKIVAHYVQNFENGKQITAAGNAVLYHRWSEDVEVDEAGYSKRTRKGQFKLRSDNVDGLTPDDLAGRLVSLSIPSGFVRERSRRGVLPDGLTLEYELVDQEVYRYPAPPSFKSEGRYTESGSGLGCPVRKADVYVKLTGDANTDQAALVLAATRITVAKLKLVGAEIRPAPPAQQNAANANPLAARGRGFGQRLLDLQADLAVAFAQGFAQQPVDGPKLDRAILERYELTVDLYKNVVEARLAARFVGRRKRLDTIAGVREAGLTTTPLSAIEGGRRGTPPPMKLGGTAKLLLQAAEYWDNRNANDQQLKPAAARLTDNPALDYGNSRVQFGGTQAGGIANLPGESGKNKEA